MGRRGWVVVQGRAEVVLVEAPELRRAERQLLFGVVVVEKESKESKESAAADTGKFF